MVACMKTVITSRTLHNWLSVALVVPLFIVGMTTFFMAHEKSLGDIVIGYSHEPIELKDILYTPNGRKLLASKVGVFEYLDGGLVAIDSFHGQDIRTLELLDDGQILAAGKRGLWLESSNGSWSKHHDGDIHGLQVYLNDWYIVTKMQGVLVSEDRGGSWQEEPNYSNSLENLSVKSPLQLGKFMNDLHTGKALLGKHYEWIWQDLLALVLVILSLTGIYMWWKSQKRKLSVQQVN